MVRARSDVERPEAGWGVFFSETLLFGLVSVALFTLVGRVPDGRADLGFLCAIALVLHALAFVRLVDRFETFLSYECPSCQRNFHGYPDRYPVPFRKSCAHCGDPAQPST